MTKAVSATPETKDDEGPKHPRIGPAYQHSVEPWDPSKMPSHDELVASANCCSVCIWDPSRVDPAAFDRYLSSADAACARFGITPICVAGGSVRYSIERAIETLADRFGYDTEAAIQALDRMDTVEAVRDAVLPRKDDDWRWHDGDRRLFEYAYKRFGSDFNAISDFMAPDKSVSQVQRFYYTWKRTSCYFDAVYRPVKRSKRSNSASENSDKLSATSTATVNAQPQN